MTKIKLEVGIIQKKREKLKEIETQLQNEFFGLDEIIGKIIKSISAWYIFPEIITRPIIINLWGMTGVGKTHLVRRLVSLLEFDDKFAELQMNSGKTDSDYSRKSILSILSSSKIEEGNAGILLIDEMQRFKTVDEHGADIQSDAFQDIWMLLSDGKFSANSSVFKDIEQLIAQQMYYQDQAVEEKPDKKNSKTQKNKFRIYPYEAQSIKKILRLQEPVTEIMEWSINKIMEVVDTIQTSRTDWTIDYTKLLIFISGNLDAAYTGSTSIEDCDTDADFYHNVTKNINISDIKHVLLRKFRPEQISRFGNNHIIYPSLSKDSYVKLINRTCSEYLSKMEDITGIEFKLSTRSYDVIYNNSVYPTQGTRPVFSAIHQIFSNPLINAAMWGVEHLYENLELDINEINNQLIVTDIKSNNKINFSIDLEISSRKSKASVNFKTYVSVHESGHAMVMSLLRNCAPMEVKINAASFTGGYVLSNAYVPNEILTKSQLKDNICICLAGAAAEELIFGKDRVSTGACSDREKATGSASQYIRHHGFGKFHSKIMPESAPSSENYANNTDDSNSEIEQLLEEQHNRAIELIKNNYEFFVAIVDALKINPVITSAAFIELSAPYVQLTLENEVAYADMWEQSKNTGVIRIFENKPLMIET